MQLSGKIIVFVHEFSYYNEKGVAMQGLRYNTSVSRKEESGDYTNASLEVVFSKNVAEEYALEDNFDEGDMLEVDIKEAWLTCRGWEDSEGNPRRVLQAFVNTVKDLNEYVPQDKKPAKAPAKKPATKKASKTAR